MFDEAKAKILEKLLRNVDPNRDFDIKKIGKNYVRRYRDHVGCRDFLLKGKYSYNQVVELNKLTGFSAGFGFCEGLGPVAFIGVPNENYVQRSGYFYHEVQAYGQSFNDEEYYFEQYSDEVAKQIGNYTVYGMGNPRVLEDKAPIEKVNYFYDYRYKIKADEKGILSNGVLAMDIRLAGIYSFEDARYFAYSSKGKFTGSSGEDVPIQFAIVGDNTPVGIMGLWEHYDNLMFRDVWGLNEEEPKHQTIRFLSDEEAKKISNFKLYYFVPTHSYGKKKFVAEKVDRTLNENFDFVMEDGTDYRLKNVVDTKEKVMTLNNK